MHKGAETTEVLLVKQEAYGEDILSFPFIQAAVFRGEAYKPVKVVLN